MLYARINKEYINQDELAKKIVFERTISQVNKLYGEQKEVSMKPGQLSSQLKYGFDSLFEGFRSAIEQVLAADYNGDITTQKTYEIIKKYNQLSSYLKNVVNMKQLSPDDEETIKKSFNELKDKLELLKQIAIDNNFLDREDIIDMVDKINETSTQPKQELEKVSGKTTGMTQAIQDKNASLKLINDAINKLVDMDQDLNDANIANSTKLQDLRDEYKTLFDFFNDPDINPLEYALVQQNYDAIKILENDIKNDIAWFIDTKKQLMQEGKRIEDILSNGFESLDDAKLNDMVANKIEEPEKNEIDAIQQAFDARGDKFKAKTSKIKAKENDIKTAQKKWRGFLTQLTADAIQKRNDEMKTFPPKIRNDYTQTDTAQKNNDALDENELVAEEKKIERILGELNNFEKAVTQAILTEVDKNLFKIAKVVGKPPTVNIKVKNITANPPTATPPKQVVSKAVVNPIYQTLQTFADNYKKTAADRKINQMKYKVFTGVYTTDRVIGNAWKKYQALPDANKKTYFT